ncbi:MAG: hypothetical protein VXZ24_11555 [Pseudomonadota bacterium]|nr:hypothetical protein [Pseudomonadota bacterium]
MIEYRLNLWAHAVVGILAMLVFGFMAINAEFYNSESRLGLLFLLLALIGPLMAFFWSGTYGMDETKVTRWFFGLKYQIPVSVIKIIEIGPSGCIVFKSENSQLVMPPIAYVGEKRKLLVYELLGKIAKDNKISVKRNLVADLKIGYNCRA